MFAQALTNIDNGGSFNPDEIALIRGINAKVKERYAISAKFMPSQRRPTANDMTQEFMAQVDRNGAALQLLFEELHGMPRDRFLPVMDLLVISLTPLTTGNPN